MPSAPWCRSWPALKNGALRERMVDKCQNDQQPTCQNGEGDMPQAIENIGAGEGNRTLVISLEGNQNYNRLNALVDKFPFCVPFDIVQQMARVHHRATRLLSSIVGCCLVRF